ncbi:MAG: DUF983 domain-containing protein [Alphaproteobacteria bacterium]
MNEAFYGDVSPFRAGFGCRCPRCGRGRLFKGFLDIAETCAVCGLDLTRQDSGDGPAVFVILILGFVIVGLALVVEVNFSPPLWLHLLLWFPLILGGSIGLLRPFKATLVALQYRHRVQFDSDDEPG